MIGSMRAIMTAFAWGLFVSASFANITSPKFMVDGVIRRAHDGVIVGVDFDALSKDSRHAWTKDSLLKFLGGIDLEKIAYQANDKNPHLDWFDIDEKRALVRLIEPIRVDFEVTFVADRSHGCGGYLRITKVSP
jgi:hypothetical protein